MKGNRNILAAVRERYVGRYEKGDIIFSDGDKGMEMFSLLRGLVGIRKDGREIAVIPDGKCFGEMSFLLSMPRAPERRLLGNR